jgi:hypothetical protein
MRILRILFIRVVSFATILLLILAAAHAGCIYPEKLAHGLEQADVTYYSGDQDAGGLAHIHYWTIDATTLSGREQMKATRIQANWLHSTLFQPNQVIPGYEATGVLDVQGRRQWITLKLPDDWNGRLVVCGTPGLRNEYANEATLVPWLLESGYAVISGNKGLESSWISMLSGAHPSQHWGQMMHDLARWARGRLVATTYRRVPRISAVGFSNGGYQVRRALEIDNNRPWWRRLFHGGLDWSGTYFADIRVLDTNYDSYQYVPGYESWRGVGYHNLISYVYRAELLGHDMDQAKAYSCFSDPDTPDAYPPLYNWLETAVDGGWTPESVRFALVNANTG